MQSAWAARKCCFLGQSRKGTWLPNRSGGQRAPPRRRLVQSERICGMNTDAKGNKLAIIAALEREITPLVRGWKITSIESQRRTIKIFENDHALVACGGIGGISARIATDAA